MIRYLVSVLFIAVTVCAETRTKVGDVVMITGGGDLSPSGVVASVSQLATLAAQSTANAQAAQLLQQAQSETDAKADAFEALLAAREGTVWIEAFNVLRIGDKAAVNTNITAEIIKTDWRVRSDATNVYHRLYTFFSEDTGYDPVTRIGKSLGNTNTWEQATTVSNWLADVTIGTTVYQDCSVSEFGVPKAWSNAFMRVGSEVRGVGTNQTDFPVNNGIKVKGEEPLTLVVTYGTNKLRIVGGVLCIPK